MHSTVNSRDSFTWKYFNISESSELKNLKKIFLENLPDFDNFFKPLDLGIKEFLGLEVRHSVLICAKPNSKNSIHVDYRADQLKLALNIPLENCESSVTTMWDCGDSEPIYTETPLGIPYNIYNINHCKILTHFILDRPVIFNTKIPHSVRNFSDKYRLAISLRFAEDPWSLVGL